MTRTLSALLLIGCLPQPQEVEPQATPVLAEPVVFDLAAAETLEASFAQGVDLGSFEVTDGDFAVADLSFRMNYGRAGMFATLSLRDSAPLCELEGPFADIAEVAASTGPCLDSSHILWTNYLDGTDGLRAMRFELDGQRFAGLVSDVEVDEIEQYQASITATLTLVRLE